MSVLTGSDRRAIEKIERAEWLINESGTEPLHGKHSLAAHQQSALDAMLTAAQHAHESPIAAWQAFEKSATAYLAAALKEASTTAKPQSEKPAREEGDLLEPFFRPEPTAAARTHTASHVASTGRKPRTNPRNVQYGEVTHERESGALRTAARGGTQQTRDLFYAWKEFCAEHKLSNTDMASICSSLGENDYYRANISMTYSNLAQKGQVRPLFRLIRYESKRFFDAVETIRGTVIPEETRKALCDSIELAIANQTTKANARG